MCLERDGMSPCGYKATWAGQVETEPNSHELHALITSPMSARASKSLAVVPAPDLLESAVVVRSALLGQRNSNMVGLASLLDRAITASGIVGSAPWDRRD